MANNPCEEIFCDNHDNSSITSTPSRSVSDKEHDNSSTKLTKASSSNQIAEQFFSFDEPLSNISLLKKSDSIIDNTTVNRNAGKSCEECFDDFNNKSLITSTSSKIINDDGHHGGDIKKKTILTILSCRNQKPEYFFSFDDVSSSVDNPIQSPTKVIQNYTLKQNINKLQNIDITTGHDDFHTQTLQKKNSNRAYVSMEGHEKIDFLNQFTKNENFNPILEGIFSYLSYKDIASMISVSSIWQNAIINSTVAQKKMETTFIQAILYFCNANVNVDDEYKCLFENILFDLKKHLQFNRQTPY